jgi:hypothetical protein
MARDAEHEAVRHNVCRGSWCRHEARARSRGRAVLRISFESREKREDGRLWVQGDSPPHSVARFGPPGGLGYLKPTPPKTGETRHHIGTHPRASLSGRTPRTGARPVPTARRHSRAPHHLLQSRLYHLSPQPTSRNDLRHHQLQPRNPSSARSLKH